MAFTWLNSTNQDDYIEEDQVSEIRDKIFNLDANIAAATPSVVSVTFNEPLAQYDLHRDEVIDELQSNLDYLKENNWCRGHYSDRYVSDNTSDKVVDNLADFTTNNDSEFISDNSGYNTTDEDSKFSSDFTGNRATNYPTYLYRNFAVFDRGVIPFAEATVYTSKCYSN